VPVQSGGHKLDVRTVADRGLPADDEPVVDLIERHFVAKLDGLADRALHDSPCRRVRRRIATGKGDTRREVPEPHRLAGPTQCGIGSQEVVQLENTQTYQMDAEVADLRPGLRLARR
jgi:hypothetical protein